MDFPTALAAAEALVDALCAYRDDPTEENRNAVVAIADEMGYHLYSNVPWF